MLSTRLSVAVVILAAGSLLSAQDKRRDIGGQLGTSPVKVAPVREAGPPNPGEERSFEIANGVKMVFCWIPADTATLGSPESEKEHEKGEAEHEYHSKGFWLGKYAVTQEEWTAVMGTTPFVFHKDGGGRKKSVQGLDTSRFPAEDISWDDCQDFLTKVNRREGASKAFGQAGKFVLPVEDEWEFACRGGKGNKQPFYWGDSLNGDKANCDGNFPYGTQVKGTYKERPMPVGSYESVAKHPWNLCDMHGNVWQWCENWSDSEKKYRSLRGGSWFHSAQVCRAAYRDWSAPGDRIFVNGCRVCFRLN